MTQRPLRNRLFYDFLHVVCRLLAVVLFRVRVEGREKVPGEGGLLVLSNHQSHFDPVLVGLACDRRLSALARKSLFEFGPFAALISFLDAIPIDRDGFGLGGIKETLKRLRSGRAVLIFPEGTRTRDGEVGKLKPGVCALARRGRVPLVPVGIEGAYDAWPRTRALPRRAVIYIHFGPPLMPEEIKELSDDELLAEVDRRIRACHTSARRHRSIVCQTHKLSTASPCPS